jgi:hypothetical protein
MGTLAKCDSPFSLDTLAVQIRKSSNFRFDWQFFRLTGIDSRSPSGVRQALDSIIATDDLHQFLRESFEATYNDEFEIGPLHEHCRIAAASDEFDGILAAAAGDHLGAYSRELRPATADEKREVRELFGRVGNFCAYQLLPGDISGCPACREHGSHLFTTWFYGVAWDWCLLASWPDRELFWMGCLTDTD